VRIWSDGQWGANVSEHLKVEAVIDLDAQSAA
jgi:hypothetical protein